MPVGSQSRRCRPNEVRRISGRSVAGSSSSSAVTVSASAVSMLPRAGGANARLQRAHSAIASLGTGGRTCTSPQSAQPMSSAAGRWYTWRKDTRKL